MASHVWHSWSEERKADHLSRFREYVSSISNTFCMLADVSRKTDYQRRDGNTTKPGIGVDCIERNASSDSEHCTTSSTISFSDPQRTTENQLELHHLTNLQSLVLNARKVLAD